MSTVPLKFLSRVSAAATGSQAEALAVVKNRAAGLSDVDVRRRRPCDLIKGRATWPIQMTLRGTAENDAKEGPDAIAPAESFISWRRGEAVRLKLTDSGAASMKPITVMTFLRETTEKVPNNLALASKTSGNYTYEDYYNVTRQVARGFIELGLEADSAVGILGFNSPEWMFSNLGAIFAGAYATGIYLTNSPDACHYVANHAQCQIIVVDDDTQLNKILSIRNRLPHLKAIIQYRGELSGTKIDGVYSWSELLAIGRQSLERELEARIKAQAPNKCCTLIYTSGTSGDPKGVMLSHDNLVWTTLHISDRIGAPFGEAARLVSYLPLSHVAAQVGELYGAIAGGWSIHFAQPDALRGSLGQTIKEVRPSIVLGVPRVWEKMHEAIMAAGQQSGPIKRRVVQWARAAGTRGNIALMSKREPSLSSKIADRVVLSKIRKAIGVDQAHLCISAAAPISRKTLDFFVSLNMSIIEIYGMSETTGPHACGTSMDNVVGSVGCDLPGTRTLICEPDKDGVGEMLLNGRNVCMGYLDMEEKTKEAFGGPDGTYIRSGDLAKRDEQGYLHVTGRIKEIIITAGGENIPSTPIESAVRDQLPILSNCMLVGDARPYLTLLITIKTNVDANTLEPLNTLTPDVISWCRTLGSEAETVRDIINDSVIHDVIQKSIDEVNQKATSSAQRIQKWKILPVDFSIAGGEMGPTLKLRRHIVLAKYSNLIDAMYAEQSHQSPRDTANRDVIRQPESVTSSIISSNYNV